MVTLTRGTTSARQTDLRTRLEAAEDDLAQERAYASQQIATGKLNDDEWMTLQSELSFAYARLEEAQRALEGQDD